MNNLCIERDPNGYYVYFINAALVFAVLYGYYNLDPAKEDIYFESKSLVCGETVTQYFPPNTRRIDVRVDVSYLFWVNVYKGFFNPVTRNLCLLTTGWLFHTRCDEIPCSSSIIKSPQPNDRLTYGGDSVPLLNRDYTSIPSRCEITKPHREIYSAASDNPYTSDLHKICNDDFGSGYNNNVENSCYTKKDNSIYLRNN